MIWGNIITLQRHKHSQLYHIDIPLMFCINNNPTNQYTKFHQWCNYWEFFYIPLEFHIWHFCIVFPGRPLHWHPKNIKFFDRNLCSIMIIFRVSYRIGGFQYNLLLSPPCNAGFKPGITHRFWEILAILDSFLQIGIFCCPRSNICFQPFCFYRLSR